MVLDKNFVELSPIFFCKIYNFAEQNFNVGSIVWPEIPKSHFKNCREMLKSITDGGLQPKIWVESKKFCLHFFSLHLTEKKLGQAFFHQNTILRVSSYFITSHPRNSNFGIFSPKIDFFAKTVDLSKKCRTVTPHKIEKK